MRAKPTAAFAAMVAAFVVTAPVSAHHSTNVFETTTPIRVKGTVVKFNWGSPHTAIIVEQVTDDGEKVRWALENSGRIDMLEALGYTRDSFKPGDAIEACGFAPRRQYAPTLPLADAEADAKPVAQWLDGAERVITARFLLTEDGPETDWSHYGPLELCITEDELDALAP